MIIKNTLKKFASDNLTKTQFDDMYQKIMDEKKISYEDADKIVIEEVYGLAKTSHEVYYFKNNKLVLQIDFN